MNNEIKLPNCNKSIREIFENSIIKAIKHNKENGVPNVFSVNGKPIFVMPNGELKTEFDWSLLKIKK